jgi:hypothetical protein
LEFSYSDIPILSSGDDNGTINFWDLNEKKIFSTIKNAHNVNLKIIREKYPHLLF